KNTDKKQQLKQGIQPKKADSSMCKTATTDNGFAAAAAEKKETAVFLKAHICSIAKDKPPQRTADIYAAERQQTHAMQTGGNTAPLPQNCTPFGNTAAPNAKPCLTCYSQNFGRVSAYVQRRVSHWLQQGLSAQLVCAAIEQASGAGARGWNYIDAILQRCDSAQITTQQAYFAQKNTPVTSHNIYTQAPPTDALMRANINKILSFA
ncbi:MAG: DnaD domain protein, partial [Pygmaiobacter sp.]|nr:DnaD domain protein [Pygmaiobacter sp.]